MLRDDFCMFILSHGRADRIYTLKSLEKAGYTGDWYIVIDDEDETADAYYKRYGDRVIMFDKLAVSKTFDTADNFDDRKTIVYARNACFDIAKKLGYTYFMQLDDDYISFTSRFDKKGAFKQRGLTDLDFIINKTIDFYDRTGADCVAFAQGGDFIGGKDGMGKDIRIKRKAMNTLLCSTKRPFQFIGRINEDVNTYVRLGQVGKLFITVNFLSINQKQTQSNKGGMTDIYLDSGTYVKSFYTIMYAPSAVRITKMGNKDKRIHHKVNWRYAIPCILNERYKKGGEDWLDPRS